MSAIAVSASDDREAEVWRQLAEVFDPELDEPITDLGFVERLQLDGPSVAIRFRLPTYWCAPNFAFLMAGDIRDRVSRLSWVRRVDVDLVDHCTSDAINEGLAAGRSFNQVFPTETTGELVELRLTFRRKAFMSRQEQLVRCLRHAGWSPESLIDMTLDQLCGRSDLGIEGDRLRARYLAVREELGLSPDGAGRAITTVDGRPVTIESFELYVRRLRTCRINMEINSHFCRGLLQVRYGLPSASPAGGSVESVAERLRPDRPAPDRLEPIRWMGSAAKGSGR